MKEGWHADQALLERYARGESDQTLDFSLEAHLLKCALCRSTAGRIIPQTSLERMRHGVLNRLDEPRPGPMERLLRRAKVSDHTARLLAATPPLQLSWFIAVIIALAFGVVAAYQGDSGLAFFLVVAPLLPVAGVALAFGPGVDPTYEVSLAAPMSSGRLLLIRSAAVLATTTTLAGLGALVLPILDWRAAAWLVPSFALTLGSLSLSTFVSPMRAAAGVAAAWIALNLLAARVSSDQLAIFHAAPQTVLGLLGAIAFVMLILRRGQFETRKNR